MNKKILLSILFFGFGKLFCQTADSLTMGAGSPSYPYDVYYNLSSQQKDTFNSSNWHLAFALRPALPPANTMQSTTIRINEGRGVALYKSTYTKATWSSFTDTTGMSNWMPLHNNNHTWDVGAFNADMDTTNPFDYGWGQYDMSSHDVTGTKVYLLVVPNGSAKVYKKITIGRIIFDTTWIYTIANLDGTDSVTQVLNKSIFNKKLFAYYNVNSKTTIDREPNHPWDLLFTYYRDLAGFGGPPSYFNFMGVLQAPQLQVARVIGIPKLLSDTLNAVNYSRNISTIGWDWKRVYLGPPPSGPYDLTDSLTYFIKRDHDSAEVFKFYFTMFTNTPANNIVFNTSIIATHVGLTTIATNIGELTVYPNPANTELNVSLKNNKTNQVQVCLYDLTGKKVMDAEQHGFAKESVTTLNVSQLQKGIYFIAVTTTAGTEVRKVLVN